MLSRIIFILAVSFLHTNLLNAENTIEVVIKRNLKHQIRGVVWFDNTNIRGKELFKQVKKSTRIIVPSTNGFGILRVIYSNLHYYEYLIRSGDSFYLKQTEDNLELNTNAPYKKFDLSVDSLLRTNMYSHQDPIKLYLHPGDIVDWGKSSAVKEENKIKEMAHREALGYIPKAINMIDSLKNNGYLSTNIAAYYQDKLEFQHLYISLLDGILSTDSLKKIFHVRTLKLGEYPYRNLYKFGELVANELYVKTAKRMNLNDGLNRDVTEIYDNIVESNILPQVIKNQLSAYYLKGIIYSFPKATAIKYYNMFIKSTNDFNLVEEVKSENYSKLFTIEFKSSYA